MHWSFYLLFLFLFMLVVALLLPFQLRIAFHNLRKDKSVFLEMEVYALRFWKVFGFKKNIFLYEKIKTALFEERWQDGPDRQDDPGSQDRQNGPGSRDGQNGAGGPDGQNKRSGLGRQDKQYGQNGPAGSNRQYGQNVPGRQNGHSGQGRQNGQGSLSGQKPAGTGDYRKSLVLLSRLLRHLKPVSLEFKAWVGAGDAAWTAWLTGFLRGFSEVISFYFFHVLLFENKPRILVFPSFGQEAFLFSGTLKFYARGAVALYYTVLILRKTIFRAKIQHAGRTTGYGGTSDTGPDDHSYGKLKGNGRCY